MLVSSSDDRHVRVWDPRTGASLAVLRGHTAAVSLVNFAPGDSVAISASEDGTCRVWDLRDRDRYVHCLCLLGWCLCLLGRLSACLSSCLLSSCGTGLKRSCGSREVARTSLAAARAEWLNGRRSMALVLNVGC